MTDSFRLDGVRCPPRVCRIVLPTLLNALKENIRAYGADGIDSEVAAWIRAVQAEAERDTCADASLSGRPADGSPHSENSDHLTTKELADELGCTPSNVRDLVRRQRLTPARTDPYIFDRAEVDRFLELRR